MKINSFKQFLAGEVIMTESNDQAKKHFEEASKHAPTVVDQEKGHQMHVIDEDGESHYWGKHDHNTYSSTDLEDQYDDDTDEIKKHTSKDVRLKVKEQNPHLSDQHVWSAAKMILKNERKRWTDAGLD